MAYRRLVAILTGGDTDRPVLRNAFALADTVGGRVDALFVRRNAASGGDFLGDAFSTYGMEAVLEALDDAAAEASHRAHEAFNEVTDDVPPSNTGRFVEFIGLPRSAMATEGRVSDLMLIAKPEGQDIPNQLNKVETAAFESGRPVLALPSSRDPVGLFERVHIAWDGSLEASRAVAGAMPLLRKAESVAILYAGIDGEAAESLAALAQYLESHGVGASTRSIPLEGRSAAKTLIEAAVEDKSELLVMGGFGAPGWQRSLGRDETTALLKGTPFSILLAH